MAMVSQRRALHSTGDAEFRIRILFSENEEDQPDPHSGRENSPKAADCLSVKLLDPINGLTSIHEHSRLKANLCSSQGLTAITSRSEADRSKGAPNLIRLISDNP
jgi:hypothetical protein